MTTTHQHFRQDEASEPAQADESQPINPPLKIDLGDKSIDTSIENLRNASVLAGHFAPSEYMGPLDEADIDWGRLIDEMGYAEMVAARHTLKTMGMLEQADAIGSPGGISFRNNFNLDAMIRDVEQSLK